MDTANKIYKIVNELDMRPEEAEYIFSTSNEGEYMVRMGKRKYVLCKNIVYMAIPRKAAVKSIHEIHSKMKNKENAKVFLEEAGNNSLTKGQTHLHFACRRGKFVYLAKKSVVGGASKWIQALTSR